MSLLSYQETKNIKTFDSVVIANIRHLEVFLLLSIIWCKIKVNGSGLVDDDQHIWQIHPVNYTKLDF